MMNTPSATARSRASGRLRLMLLSIMTVLFVSACSQRIGVSWADLTIANANQDILVAYENSITLVSRVNGFVVTEDMEGTTNNPDAAGTWRLRNSDAGSEYFTTPLRVGEVDGDQMLIIADYNNRLYYANFDRACFSTQLGSCVDQEPPFVELAGHVVADLGEDDERIYVPFAENDVVALNKGIYASDWDRDDDQERRRRFDETLTTAWTFETERGVWAQPVVLDGSVYIATMDHRLHRLDAETGEEQATIDLGSAIASSPVLYDGTPATDYADDVAVAPDPE
ncbi:MAG: PQQ-binding-like beta-propeller repeat protein, partial [Chloroflexota bacterium]